MYTDLLLAIIAATVFILFRYYTHGRKHEHSILCILYFAFLLCVVYFTMLKGDRAELTGFKIEFPLPFWKAIQNHRYGSTTNRSVLNIILFIPLGYLIPSGLTLKRGQKIKWWQVTLCGFIISFTIETTQLVFHRGVFELDDLVKNTMGTAIGYGI